MNAVLQQEGTAFSGLKALEDDIKASPKKAYKRLNAYTKQIFENTTAAWKNLEADYWHMFGMGF